MKKKIIAILFILLLLTGCSKSEDKYNVIEHDVKEDLKVINNITEKNIKEQYTYIKENYTKRKDEDLIYACKYIQTLGKYNNNELTELADQVISYSKTKKNKKDIKKTIEKVDKNYDILSHEIYLSYFENVVYKEMVENKKEQAIADAQDKTMHTAKDMETAITYISANYLNPYKSEEILKNLTYYSLFLSNLNSDNEIVSLGKAMLSYLGKTSDDNKSQVEKYLESINKNKTSKINNLLNSLK